MSCYISGIESFGRVANTLQSIIDWKNGDNVSKIWKLAHALTDNFHDYGEEVYKINDNLYELYLEQVKSWNQHYKSENVTPDTKEKFSKDLKKCKDNYWDCNNIKYSLCRIVSILEGLLYQVETDFDLTKFRNLINGINYTIVQNLEEYKNSPSW